jgi:hypothetical protein
MRDDRVIAMARAHFNREFHDKKSAIRALAKLEPKQQHALVKPRDPSRSAKPKPAVRSRGGSATPFSGKLADAPDAVVKRYARMTTGLDTKSKAQALTLMAKFAPAGVAEAAGSALGQSGLRKQNGPTKADLVAQYREAFGVRPSSKTKRTKASLEAALKTAPKSVPVPTTRGAAPTARMLALDHAIVERVRAGVLSPEAAAVRRAAVEKAAVAAGAKLLPPPRMIVQKASWFKGGGATKLALAAGVAVGAAAVLASNANAQEKPDMAEKKSDGAKAVAAGVGSTMVVSGMWAGNKGGALISSAISGGSPAARVAKVAAGVGLMISGTVSAIGGSGLLQRAFGRDLDPAKAEPAKPAPAPQPVDQSVANALLNKRIEGRLPAGNEQVMSERIPHMLTPGGYTDKLRAGAYANDSAKAKAQAAPVKAGPAPSTSRPAAAAPAKSPVGTYERTYKSGAKAGLTETVTIKPR